MCGYKTASGAFGISLPLMIMLDGDFGVLRLDGELVNSVSCSRRHKDQSSKGIMENGYPFSLY